MKYSEKSNEIQVRTHIDIEIVRHKYVPSNDSLWYPIDASVATAK